jgi:hypothetical protein
MSNECPACGREGFGSNAKSGHKIRICSWRNCQYYERKIPTVILPYVPSAIKKENYE